ncbi:unnamed protein product [Closterium sp. Naga37s-1]|nr:unnamed protein product [Closterium sp. Naga37s-1]
MYESTEKHMVGTRAPESDLARELLGSDSGLARVLCEYSTRAGRWEVLVEEVQNIEEELLGSNSGLELLGSNSGLARVLCEYSTRAGRWEALVEEVQTIEEVTPTEGKAGSGALAGPVGRAGPGGLSEPQGLGWSQEERRAGGVGGGESVGEGGKGGDGLRIAWQYKHLAPQFTGVGLGGPVGASVPYCTEFDLRAPLSRPSLRHAQQLCTCVPMGVDAVMMIGTDGNCAQQAQQQHQQQQQQQHQGEEEGSGPASDFTQGFFGRVSGFLSSIDSPTPGGSTGIGERGMEGRGGGSGGGGRGGEGGGRVGRIGVHSLGAPPALLLSGNDAQCFECAAETEAAACSRRGAGDALEVTTLVLRAVNRKRQIVVEEAHPPPIDATGGAAGSSGGGGSVGCGSSGGGSGALDF